MPFQLPPHVRRRGAALYLNLPIPAKVRHHFLTARGKPRTHVVEALGTSDLREAVEQVRIRSGIWAKKFRALEGQGQGRAEAQSGAAIRLAKELRQDLAQARDEANENGAEALEDLAQEHAERIEAKAGPEAAKQFYALATKTGRLSLLEAVEEMERSGATTAGTNKKRRQQLQDLLDFLRLPDCHPEHITEARAVAYVEALNRSTLSKSTKQDRLSGLQGIWRFLERKRQVPRGSSPWGNHEVTEPARQEGGKTKEGKRRGGWTEQELVALFRAPDFDDGRQYSRALFRELYALGLITGMRLDEVVSIRPSDLEPIRGGLVVHIKKSKTEAGIREVPVVHTAAVAILKRRAKAQTDKGASIFPECRPGGPDNKLSWQVQKALGRDRAALGFGSDVDFHATRRNFMTLMENAKVSQVHAQRYVGHRVSTLMHTVYSAGANRENLRKIAAAVKYPARVEALLRQAAGLSGA